MKYFYTRKDFELVAWTYVTICVCYDMSLFKIYKQSDDRQNSNEI